nr:hypothetical protein [Mucilaginibacter pineti]
MQSLYRGKKLEIGENFYFMNGELMAMIKKNIAYWRQRGEDRSDRTLAFLRQEVDRLDAYQAKLQAENWKYNLIGIYFAIPYSFQEMLEDNQRSHELYLQVLDYSERIRVALPSEKDDFFLPYQEVIEGLCTHYLQIYNKMEGNMEAVKTAHAGRLRRIRPAAHYFSTVIFSVSERQGLLCRKATRSVPVRPWFSQVLISPRSRIAGIRSWIVAISRLGGMVIMAKVGSNTLVSMSSQISHKPAM